MTPILGELRAGQKTTLRSLEVLPECVIYDLDLTLSLPTGLSVTSGINAIVHAVEALYAVDRNPVSLLKGIRAISRALPQIVSRSLMPSTTYGTPTMMDTTTSRSSTKSATLNAGSIPRWQKRFLQVLVNQTCSLSDPHDGPVGEMLEAQARGGALRAAYPTRLRELRALDRRATKRPTRSAAHLELGPVHLSELRPPRRGMRQRTFR
jgi:hypothetical protein